MNSFSTVVLQQRIIKLNGYEKKMGNEMV